MIVCAPTIVIDCAVWTHAWKDIVLGWHIFLPSFCPSWTCSFSRLKWCIASCWSNYIYKHDYTWVWKFLVSTLMYTLLTISKQINTTLRFHGFIIFNRLEFGTVLMRVRAWIEIAFFALFCHLSSHYIHRNFHVCTFYICELLYNSCSIDKESVTEK